MRSYIPVKSIEKSFQSALSKGLIREEDTAVIFYDMTFLEERVIRLKSIFPPSAVHGIAMKANPLIRILEILQKLDVGTEVASLGELYLAEKTGYRADKIVYDSPVKTFSDFEYALKAGIHINVDSLSELERISSLKKVIASSGTVGIRINPQVGSGTILESSVAGEYSKFGVPIEYNRKNLTEAFRHNAWLTGVHLHVGSQGCPMELLVRGIGVIFDFTQEVNQALGSNQINIFDIGGGLPVSYDSSTQPVSMEEYARTIRDNHPSLFTDHYKLFTEFGRWVHVNAGWTASRVEYVKREPKINTVMIHVGADLFPRECLNPKDWQHRYSVHDKNGILKTGKDMNPYNIAGPLCFSGDILARNVEFPVVEEGDYVIVHDSGGYTFSMWSRYNSRQTPRILGYLNEGDHFEILKDREELENILSFWR